MVNRPLSLFNVIRLRGFSLISPHKSIQMSLYPPNYSDVTQDRRSRSRSRSRSGSRQRRRFGSYGAGGGAVMVTRARVPSYLRVKGTKAFTMTAQPFCLALGQGTAPGTGMSWYGIASVPALPVYSGFSNWALAFNLSGVNCCVNGLSLYVAPVNNYAEYTALFDSYRLRKVEITMIYNSNSSTLGPGTSLPVMSIANDYDDVGATQLSSLQQYDSYRVIQFGNNCSNGKVLHSVRPKVQTVVETNAATVIAGSGTSKTWIDCNATTVAYHGVKGNYDNMNVGSAGVGFITFYVKYFVEFKNSR